jgi:dihydrofolate reductase
MRKIISQMMISLDGFIEGTNQELDWHHVDNEYHNYAGELLHSVDAILYGRKTFGLLTLQKRNFRLSLKE